jgi:uncharacterized protein YbjT (DUF2867 family)
LLYDEENRHVILITGATGNVGGELVAQLVGRGESVRAMTRRPEAARFPGGVEIVRGDLSDRASVAAALVGVDRMFLMSAQVTGSAPAPTHDIMVASCARFAGVRHIVKLSVLGGGGDDMRDPITRWHHEAEAAIRESGIEWTLLRPGRFMSNALQWAPMIRGDGKVRIAFATRPTASIDPSDIASVALRALTEPGHAGKAYELSGPETLTPTDELQILSTVLNRPLELIALPREAMREGMLRFGMPEEIVDASIARAEMTDQGTEILPTVQHVTGYPARTFAAWAQAHVAAFR